MAELTDALFAALADPTRRRILDLVAQRTVAGVGEIAREFPTLVPSGISKHLMYLRAKKLVTATKYGRERRYEIDRKTLSEALTPWLEKYRPYFSDALDRLRDLAEAEQPTADGG